MYTNMKDRLRQFLDAENVSQAEFADKINVVRASVSHILSGRNNPSYDFIKAMMLQYPHLNIEWLMFGKGKMYKSVEHPHPYTQPDDLLFPDFEEEPAVTIPETPSIPEPIHNIQSSSDINTSDKQIQVINTQRKVSKIIILYDDGTYQEM